MATFTVEVADPNALYKALLRARSAEQTEVTRANKLVSTGYGDRAGGTLSAEADAAQRRIEALNAVLEALVPHVGSNEPIPSFLNRGNA